MTVDYPPSFTWPSSLSPACIAHIQQWAEQLGRCHIAKVELMRDRDADGPVVAIVVDVLTGSEPVLSPFSILHKPSEFGWTPSSPTARYVVGIELAELDERASMARMVTDAARVMMTAHEMDRIAELTTKSPHGANCALCASCAVCGTKACNCSCAEAA